MHTIYARRKRRMTIVPRGPASNGPIKQANRRSINFRPVVCELHGNEGMNIQFLLLLGN